MKIEIQKPNIVRIAYHQEEKDSDYGRCLWAYFDFDLDLYMLNIQSDCGNAANRWYTTPESESFLELMARCDDDYILEKLFDPTTFDAEWTIKYIRNDLGIDDDEEQNELDAGNDHIKELEGTLSYIINADEAQREISDWYEMHDYDASNAWDVLVRDYTAGAKFIVKIFREYVQPKIRVMLDEKREGNE